MRLDDLPGGALVAAGLVDAAARTRSIGALLVAIGAPRLRRLGLPVPDDAALAPEPELTLYRMLRESGEGDAFSRYNALLRELVSFEHALEHRASRRSESAPAARRPGTPPSA